MRIFLTILLLLITLDALAATNSVLLVETVPASDACNMELIEAIPDGDPATFGFTGAEGTILSTGIVGDAASFGFTGAIGAALNRNTNSFELIEAPPAFNECDMELIETMVGDAASFGFTGAEGTMVTGLAGTPASFGITGATPQQKIRLNQGIQFDQGIGFDGANYLEWKASHKALVE